MKDLFPKNAKSMAIDLQVISPAVRPVYSQDGRGSPFISIVKKTDMSEVTIHQHNEKGRHFWDCPALSRWKKADIIQYLIVEESKKADIIHDLNFEENKKVDILQELIIEDNNLQDLIFEGKKRQTFYKIWYLMKIKRQTF